MKKINVKIEKTTSELLENNRKLLIKFLEGVK